MVTNCKQGATRLNSKRDSQKGILIPIDNEKIPDLYADFK